jgi:hypothetical protein
MHDTVGTAVRHSEKVAVGGELPSGTLIENTIE